MLKKYSIKESLSSNAKTFLTAIFTIAATSMYSSSVQAFPVLINVGSISPEHSIQGYPRSSLFTFFTNDGGKTFSHSSIQIDEIEDNAFLILRQPETIYPNREKVNHPGAKDPFNGTIQRFHRLVLDNANFGVCDTKCQLEAKKFAETQCVSSQGLEHSMAIKLVRPETFSFLGFCRKPVKVNPPKFETTWNNSSRILSSPQFSAQISPTSPFLISGLTLAQNKIPTIENMQISAKLRTKLLVSINIDNSDLKGEFTSVTKGPLGTSLEVAVNEKVLGFKMVSQVCCDITFFRDAFYFPIVITPPDAIGELRSNSFVAMGFESPAKIEALSPSGSASSVLLSSPEGAVAITLKPTTTKTYASTILTNKDALAEKNLEKSTSGVSLDISGKKGEQRFEVWFYLGNNANQVREYATHGAQYSIQKF